MVLTTFLRCAVYPPCQNTGTIYAAFTTPTESGIRFEVGRLHVTEPAPLLFVCGVRRDAALES